MSFRQSEYTIDESNALVQIFVVLSRPSLTNITIEVININGLADGEAYISYHIWYYLMLYIGGIDYDSGPYNFTFLAGITDTSFDVLLINDKILEDNETFVLAINQFSLPNNITIHNISQTTVTILDDDCKYYIHFMMKQ